MWLALRPTAFNFPRQSPGSHLQLGELVADRRTRIVGLEGELSNPALPPKTGATSFLAPIPLFLTFGAAPGVLPGFWDSALVRSPIPRKRPGNPTCRTQGSRLAPASPIVAQHPLGQRGRGKEE